MDISKLPYAKWLEESLKNFIKEDVQAICILTKLEDGTLGSGYYECSISDKLVFAGLINQDAMIDSLEERGLIGCDDDGYTEFGGEDCT